MASEQRGRSPRREREYESRPGEHDPRFGERVGEDAAAREGFWGRGHDDDGYEHRAQREYSREDYGRGGYGEERGTDGERPSPERGFLERAADAVSSWFGDRKAERGRGQDHRGRG